MGRIVLACVLIQFFTSLARAADTKSESSKSAAVSIADVVEFYPPEGWAAAKAKDETTTKAFWKGRETFMAVRLLPASAKLYLSAGPILAKQMLEKIQGENSTIVLEPKVEEDGRFLVRVHEQHKVGEKIADQLCLYRPVAGRLLMATIFTTEPQEEDVLAAHKAGEDLLIGAGKRGEAKRANELSKDAGFLATASKSGGTTTANKAPSPRPAAGGGEPEVTAKALNLARAHIRLPAMPGWTVTPSDTSNGTVAMYRKSGWLLIVSVSAIPKDVKDHPDLKDYIITQLVAGEQSRLKLEGSKVLEKENVPDKRFLKKARTVCELQGVKMQIDSRQIMVGDMVASVASVGRVEDGSAIAEEADTLAMSIDVAGKD